jgi:hypothetical protein
MSLLGLMMVAKERRGRLLGVFFSAEGPQGKNTFDKMIQKLAEVAFSLSSAPRDEAQ